MPSRECPVLYPTLEDLKKPFEAYIEKHEKKIAEAGIAKIVAPEGWTPRRQGYPDDLDFTIERPIRQHVTGSRGLFRGLYIEQKPMSLRHDFRPMALAPDNQPPPADTPADLERRYWRNVTLRPPLYGADVAGSLFDEDCKGWTLRHLDTVLSRVLREAGHTLPGVSEPYLYFGMWRSLFAWHTEDVDLYSVNYLHFGAPKQWYCIPPDSRRRFEGLIKGMLPDLFKTCPEFFRHKELIISPQLLDTFAIPYIRSVQRPREFVINYPGAYHAGYNMGYNCAESVNFGTRRWIPLGAVAAVCQCNPDSVSIDMRLFRHLVPARLLPPSIFEDTSSEEEEEEEEEASSSSASDSELQEVEDSEDAEKEVGRKGAGRGRGRGKLARESSSSGGGRGSERAAAAKRGGISRGRGGSRGRGRGDGGVDTAGEEGRRSTRGGRGRGRGTAVSRGGGAGRGRGGATTATRGRGAAAGRAGSRRVAPAAAEGTTGTTAMPPEAAAVAVATAAAGAPKRRGRPPKAATATAAAATACKCCAAATAPEAAAVEASALPLTPAKRPRGRPRKHPLLPAAAPSAAEAGAVLEVPPAKRARGRPRKVVAS